MTFPIVVFDRIFRKKTINFGVPPDYWNPQDSKRRSWQEPPGARLVLGRLEPSRNDRGILPFESFWMVYFKAWELMKPCFFSKKNGSKWIQMVENHGDNSQWFGNYIIFPQRKFALCGNDASFPIGSLVQHVQIPVVCLGCAGGSSRLFQTGRGRGTSGWSRWSAIWGW